MPQVHAPAVQPSARVELQATQATPLVPHAVSEGVVQTLFVQHPSGQDPVGPTVHWHVPLTHAWPAAQGAPVPQAQSPTLLQRSLVVVSQATQATPPLPQVACVGGVLQVLPEQQPVRQREAHPEQAPPALHVSPDGHWAQAPPPLPQAPSELPGKHSPPTQHPVPHDTRSHTHMPLRQR